jgi:hypothetical protein
VEERGRIMQAKRQAREPFLLLYFVPATPPLNVQNKTLTLQVHVFIKKINVTVQIINIS